MGGGVPEHILCETIERERFAAEVVEVGGLAQHHRQPLPPP
jgi:hypothetical protein